MCTMKVACTVWSGGKVGDYFKGLPITTIADVLLAEQYAVQLVARFDGNNLEMEKNLELMSELEKNELIQKKIIREL